MRRTSLSRKLLLAALPLLAALGVLLSFTIRTDLRAVADAQRDADLGRVSSRLLAATNSVVAEQNTAIDGILGRLSLNSEAAPGTPDADALDAASETTDAALAALTNELRLHPEFKTIKLDQAGPALNVARRLSRSWAADPSVAAIAANTPFLNYANVLRELQTVGRITQSTTGNPVTGRTLLAVSQFTDATVSGALYQQELASYQLAPKYEHLIDMRSHLLDADAALDQFEVTVTPAWAARYRQAGIHGALTGPLGHVNTALQNDTVMVAGVSTAIKAGPDSASISRMIAGTNAIQNELVDGVIESADSAAATTRREAQIRLAAIAGATLAALVIAFLITRSITRRVRAVAASANAVANEQLPTLVASIRDPRGKALPEIDEVDVRGHDEVAELATSFNSLQRTLRDVAEEQVAVLRRGVSDIFVTMARRNRSLVDRQLALLDEFEAEVEDPDVLASFYSLDHLATRMRRNSESLLVLANAEARRGRVGPTSIDTVVRAAIGEVEDYRRIDVASLEHIKVKGTAVADIAHMLAELLDNATAFSPPETVVRVGGRITPDGYQLRIDDAGVGIGEARLAELNDLLRNPPIVGLSVEPTLGISVVSLLANKHGIDVTLVATNPGLTVDVLLPVTVFADYVAPAPAAEPELGTLDVVTPVPEHVNGTTHPAVTGASNDDAVIAKLEADFQAEADREAAGDAAPSPATASPLTIDPGFSARLTDAFDRAELASSDSPGAAAGEPASEPAILDDGTFPMPIRGRAPRPTPAPFEIPVRDRSAAAEPAVAEERVVAPPTAATAASAFASFRAGAQAAQAEVAQAETSQAEVAKPEPADVTHDVPAEPMAAPAAFAPPALAAPSGPAVGFAAPAAPAAQPLPVPTLAAAPAAPAPVGRAEFAVPAPPINPAGPSVAPVVPAHATPAPRVDANPALDLPTRNRAAAAAASAAPAETAAEADAVAQALAAFDNPEPALLPSRTRGNDARYHGEYREERFDERPESTIASPLAPEQLRARLRAFQTEFRTGSSDPAASNTATDTAREARDH